MEQRMEKGDFYLVSGPANLRIDEGVVEVIAARISSGETLVVPRGKKVPVLAVEGSKLQIEVENPEESVTKMEVSSIPEEWDALAQRIVGERQNGRLYKIVVLGEVDTGKTFLSTYLANRLMEKVGKIGVLDCDTGQSDIGPPGTFGMLTMDKPTVFLSELPATHLYMIGAHSPGLHMLPAMVGLVTMLRKAEGDADAVIIDTTGWVQGDGGRAVKKAELDIIQPDMVILMQRGTELEHLVKHLPPSCIVRLPVSKKASSTSQMDRKTLREMVSMKYFKDAKVLEIPFGNVYTDRCYFKTGKQLNLEGTLYAERLSAWEGTFVVTSGPLMPELTKSWPDARELGGIKNYIAGEERGLMVSLLDEKQNVLSLARLEEIDFLKDCFRVRAPYSGSLAEIKGIQFGSLRLNEKGEEAGFMEPGNI